MIGNVGIALCSVRGGAVHLTFDAQNGSLTFSHSAEGVAGDIDWQPIEGEVARLAAASGVKVVHEKYVCDLRYLTCAWEEATEELVRLPRVDMHYSRIG